MSRSNYDKPFYVDVGTSVVAIRCASNRDIIMEYDYGRNPPMLNITKDLCDRMNKEAAIGRPLRNCDVGTADEQAKRFRAYCKPFIVCNGMCRDCPLYKGTENIVECFCKWEQLPYESEVK